MRDLHQELRVGAELLELIDRKRIETGNPGLGANIERAILHRYVADLNISLPVGSNT